MITDREAALPELHDTLARLAKPHTPEDSSPRAVSDQWLHAIATRSQPYCLPSLTQPDLLRRQITYALKKKNLPHDRRNIYNLVFGDLTLRPQYNPRFRFIDLFAGIGGIRIGFQNAGGACVFSSEKDKSARTTYRNNFGEEAFGDITKIGETSIPDHDVLLAGFPCQPFSNAGVSARTALGKKHGFLCDTEGTLFFDVLRIINQKKPKIVFLENVRNLERHNHGKTFQIIRDSITNEGYDFTSQTIDSSPLVPQRRVRCYMVCIRKDLQANFTFPEITGPPLPLCSILEQQVDEVFTISDRLWQGHINRTKRNVARGTGFTAYTADLGVCRDRCHIKLLSSLTTNRLGRIQCH